MAALATGHTLVDPVIAVGAAAWATPSHLHIHHAKFAKPRLGGRLAVDSGGFWLAGARSLVPRRSVAPAVTAFNAAHYPAFEPVVETHAAARATAFDLHEGKPAPGWVNS